MTLARILASRRSPRDLLADLDQVLLAGGRALGDQADDLVVDLGVERRERQVLELPLDGVHAQPVGERGVDLQRLAGLLLRRARRDELPRAGVVQPVGELDDEHPDVAGHGHDHLADRLGLGGVAVGDLVELGDAVDEQRDLLAEVRAQVVEAVVGVLDGVVQQRRGQRRGRHAQLGEDRRHRHGVGDVRVAALAHLPVVGALGHRVRPLEQRGVGLGVGGPDRDEQRLEDGADRRTAGAAPGPARQQPAGPGGRGGTRAPAGPSVPAVPGRRAAAGGRDLGRGPAAAGCGPVTARRSARRRRGRPRGGPRARPGARARSPCLDPSTRPRLPLLRTSLGARGGAVSLAPPPCPGGAAGAPHGSAPAAGRPLGLHPGRSAGARAASSGRTGSRRRPRRSSASATRTELPVRPPPAGAFGGALGPLGEHLLLQGSTIAGSFSRSCTSSGVAMKIDE